MMSSKHRKVNNPTTKLMAIMKKKDNLWKRTRKKEYEDKMQK